MCRPTNLVVTLLVAAIIPGCHSSAPAPPPSQSRVNSGAVVVEINHGDRTESLRIENVAEGTTVESLMRSIDKPQMTIHGSGTTAFLDSIGDKTTSSSEGWTYKIDGEFANEGIGSTTLSPPVTITWSYGDTLE